MTGLMKSKALLIFEFPGRRFLPVGDIVTGRLGVLPGGAGHVQRRAVAAIKQQHHADQAFQTRPIARRSAADIEGNFGRIGIAFLHRDQYRLPRRIAIAILRMRQERLVVISP
jgi:hypothetical protein